MAKVISDPTWHYRRRAVALTLISCFALIGLAMLSGVEMASTVIGPLCGLAGASLAFYVGGASYERTSGIPSQNKYEVNNVGI